MDLIYATIEHTIEDRPYPYMIYWHTAVEGWKDGHRNDSDSRGEDKTRED